MIIWRGSFLETFKHIQISTVFFSYMMEDSLLALRLHMISFVNDKICAKGDRVVILCKGKLVDQ